MKGVYILTFPNGKQYVGKSIRNMQVRVNKHASGKSGSPLITKAFRKYGKVEVEYHNLPDATDDEIKNYEIRMIHHLNTVSPNGYNLTGGGEGMSNVSDEVRGKMSKAAQNRMGNRKWTEEQKLRASKNKKLYWKGRKRTIEERHKQSESTKGIKHHRYINIEDIRENILHDYNIVGLSTRKIAAKYNLSKSLVAERIKQWRSNSIKIRKGYKHSEATKIKIADAHKGDKNYRYIDLEPYRELILWDYACGISMTQIGKALGISVSTISNRIKQWCQKE